MPEHLRDAHYRGAEQLGRGQEDQYSHDFEGGWVDQAYLPEERHYYEPTDRGHEAVIRQRMEELRQKASRGRQPPEEHLSKTRPPGADAPGSP